jgi:hypothetical protein
MYEIVKQNEEKRPSDFLMHLRKALRTVLRSKDYTLDASLLLKEINTHPDTARKVLELLCPISDYKALRKLFNYEEMIDHIMTYIKDHDTAQIERDMRLLRNRLKIFLGDEREVKYWGRKVSWTKNVMIPLPTPIMLKNSYDEDRDQKDYSLERSSIVVFDRHNKLHEVVLQVLETGTPNRLLFTIGLEPNQKIKEERVKILLHSYASRAGYNTRSYATEIPLNIEDRGKGSTVYSIEESSIIRNKASRWYLYADLNEIGYRKMNYIEKRIEKIQSDANMPGEKRNEIVRQHQTARKNVLNKRQYQMLTAKIKGLLLYSLVESDLEVFNEIIWNISRCNKYDKDDFDPHYDGVVFTNTKDLDPVRRMDFPFLLDYYKFSHVLPENFTFDVLRRVAEEFRSRLEMISSSELKFEVTSRFVAKVREHVWRKSILRIRNIEYIDDNVFLILSNYHSKVGAYVRRKQRLILAFEDRIWGEEISYNRLREKTLQK